MLRTLRACARGPWVAVLAVEGRVRARVTEPGARAECAGWIAANALAACGRWVRRDRALDVALVEERAVLVERPTAEVLLAALAAAPALPVAASLSRRARATLRVLGIPVLDVGAVPPGVRILVGDRAYAPGPVVALAVTGDATGYNVGVARDRDALPACG
jgi:hypothetical protein